MKHVIRLALFAVVLSPALLANDVAEATDQRPNVVFIIVDDLNDLPLAPHGKPAIATPNIDRLAQRGVSFTNAHTNDPICAPSRACMLFGLYPQSTGLYWFDNWRQNEILKQSVSLNRHLQENGYSVFGTGKVYHGGRGDNAFDEFGYRQEFGPWPWDGVSGQSFTPHPAMMYMYETDGDMDYKWEHHFGPLSMIPDWPADRANGIPGYKGWRLYGKPFRYENDEDRDLLSDELCAEWSKEIIERNHEKPYALFAGLVRTHTPLYAPDEYFERFPLDSIEVPETIANDLDDCADVLADRSLYGFRRYTMLVRHKDRQLYKQWLQAYLACVSFVDDQVGKILDAIDKSPERDNTIVVFTSDHGFHIGEKQFLYKQSLWDGATRVPLIVAGLEGMPQGVTCEHPVSLIDIYPTINELCRLPTEPNKNGNGYRLEGHSLRPLLESAAGDWTGPDVAITAIPGRDHSQLTRHQGTWFPHFSVRSKQFRYTLCANGEEELYDYETDPLEWENLASDPRYAETKASLKSQLIELRDGPHWDTLNEEDAWTFSEDQCNIKKVGHELHVRLGAFLPPCNRRDVQELRITVQSQIIRRGPIADHLPRCRRPGWCFGEGCVNPA
jgi:arylsulfatase A-like enzyme